MTVTHARTAAFFDLDKTIIATSSSAAFSRSFFQGGLITRTNALRTAYAQFLFQIGGADERQTTRLRDALAELTKGWEVAKVDAIVAETIHDHIDPVVYDEALELIQRHHEQGRDVVVVSASASEVVVPIAEMLGADAVIASRMKVKKGKYTGKIEFYAYGPAKAEAIIDLANERGYDLEHSFAYSDSITDAPMLSVVGHGFAVNPDRGLRRAAADNGWGVLRFRRPVALRSGRRRTGLAVGLVLAAAVVVTAIAISRAGRERDA